jgi:hypothetical protein
MRKSLTVAAIVLCTMPSVALSRGSMEAAAAKLSRDYLGVWSSNSSAAMRQVSFIYGSRVRFYGRLLSRSALHAEKRRFIQRWPIRRYALRSGTVRRMCGAECEMHSSRSARLAHGEPEPRGSSPRLLAVRTGVRFFKRAPLIVSESGSVLKSARRTTRG